jgi:general stress protein 26
MTQDETSKSIEKLSDLIKDIEITMFTTSGARGLRSRPMATQDTPFDGDLWFLTSDDAEVVREIQDSDQVLLTYAHPGQQEYITVNGQAEVLNDRLRIRSLWKPAFKVWFPEGENDPSIRLIKVAVTRAEYWDEPTAPMRFLHFVKAFATGQMMETGDHETVRLKR